MFRISKKPFIFLSFFVKNNNMIDSDKLVVRKKVGGKDALLYRNGVDYKVIPEDSDFEPMLARDLSEKDEDFILKGKIINKSFIATDVIYHGEFLANSPWSDRYLDLKKEFDYTPSIRMSGAVVVEQGEELVDAAKAFKHSPHFEGVYVEEYDSDIFDERVELSEKVVEDM